MKEKKKGLKKKRKDKLPDITPSRGEKVSVDLDNYYDGLLTDEVIFDEAPPEIDLDALEERIEDIDDLAVYMKCLLFGPPGSGKTTIAGSFPNVLILDCREEGTDSIRGMGGKRIKIRTWDDLEGMYWYLSTRKHKFKSVFIDTVTQALDLAMRKVIEMDDHEGLPIRKHWGQMTQLAKTLFMDFRDLPMNVGFIAHVKRQDDDDIGEDDHIRVPMMSPAVRKSVEGSVNLIGYTYIREVITEKRGKSKTDYSFRMRIGPSEDMPTKFRTPKGVKYGYVIKNPTYKKLMDILKKEE